jgi:hypothetical protein
MLQVWGLGPLSLKPRVQHQRPRRRQVDDVRIVAAPVTTCASMIVLVQPPLSFFIPARKLVLVLLPTARCVRVCALALCVQMNFQMSKSPPLGCR